MFKLVQAAVGWTHECWELVQEGMRKDNYASKHNPYFIGQRTHAGGLHPQAN